MIDIDVARRLRDAGRTWEPVDGDHFVIDNEQMRDEAFMLSSMVVEKARGDTGQLRQVRAPRAEDAYAGALLVHLMP